MTKNTGTSKFKDSPYLANYGCVCIVSIFETEDIDL